MVSKQVDWTSEKECFETFLRELAYFYVPGPLPPMDEDEEQEKAERWQIEHVLFPCARQYLNAPKSLLDRDVVQVANLPDLYRVFERC
jgi:DNA mismatch repair protein MLH1